MWPHPQPMKNPVGGSLCLAQSEEEEVWYQAVVQPLTTTTTPDMAGINVFFIDYGNCSYAMQNKVSRLVCVLFTLEKKKKVL